jgi:hypothetical protein
LNWEHDARIGIAGVSYAKKELKADCPDRRESSESITDRQAKPRGFTEDPVARELSEICE